MGKTSKTRQGRKGVKPGPRKRGSTRSKHRRSPRFPTVLVIAGIVVAVVVGTLAFLARQSHPEFNSSNAFDNLAKFVEIGPKVPGSATHRATAEWLEVELSRFADKVSLQSVVAPVTDDTLRGTNIIASFNLQPRKNSRVMLSAHWDTRPWADQDPDSAAHSIPIVGANDGGSGVAILLEIARVLHENPVDIGVDLILFDLEDSGRDSTVGFALGSAYFVANNLEYRPSFGINLDMVCDSTLQIPKEANSVAGARDIVDLIWQAAEDEGADVFVNRNGTAVMDDHVAFLQRGIRVVDLIPTPFPTYWHTLDDTIDNCSAETLGQVGNTLLRILYAQ